MINQEVSTIFSNIGDYLEMGDKPNYFRIRAFKKASEVVNKYPTDLAKLNIYQLKQISGIGESLAKDIKEYAETGKIQYYEQLKKESPVKLEELTNIQGMGPKRVKKLYYKLGVKNVKDLKKAAEQGKIANLEGFGEKSQQSILENIKFAIVNKERTRIDVALNVAKEYINYLKKNDKNLIKVKYAGSLRRKEETTGDVDILISSKNSKESHNIFVNYGEVDKVLGSGETKSSVWLKQKVQVDMRTVPNESFGTALQYFTGNVDHNVLMRKVAIKKGLKLSEYGVFNKQNKNLAKNKSEKWVYKKLVNNYIIPELRTDNGEIDLAINNNLPKVISVKDIKGDLQMHTTHSDGKNTPEQMINKCISLGYKYMGITDHFGNLGVANAVKVEEFSNYYNDLKKLKQKYKGKINLLIGAEVNIKPDGTLDFKEDLLKQLDYVLAGVHSSLQLNSQKATDRYLKVLNNPLVKIIAHPSGRLIQKRPGFEYDYTKVFNKASEKNIAFEINAHPMRLDMPYQIALKAKEAGVKISINTDAHSTDELNLIKYGVYVAKKAKVEKKHLYKPKLY